MYKIATRSSLDARNNIFRFAFIASAFFIFIYFFNDRFFKLIDPLYYNDVLAYENLFGYLSLESLNLSDFSPDGYIRRNQVWGEYITIIIFQVAAINGLSALDVHILSLSILWLVAWVLYFDGSAKSAIILISIAVSPYSFGTFLMGATRQIFAASVMLFGFEKIICAKNLSKNKKASLIAVLYLIVYNLHYGSVLILTTIHGAYLISDGWTSSDKWVLQKAFVTVVAILAVVFLVLGLEQVNTKIEAYSKNNVADQFDYASGFFTYSIIVPLILDVVARGISNISKSTVLKLSLIGIVVIVIGSKILRNSGVDRVVTCFFFIVTLKNSNLNAGPFSYLISPLRVMSLIVYLPSRL